MFCFLSSCKFAASLLFGWSRRSRQQLATANWYEIIGCVSSKMRMIQDFYRIIFLFMVQIVTFASPKIIRT
jgi:hypothetical protein